MNLKKEKRGEYFRSRTKEIDIYRARFKTVNRQLISMFRKGEFDGLDRGVEWKYPLA